MLFKNEFQKSKDILKQAKQGCFLILPLKYKNLNESLLNQQFEDYPITTLDLNDNVRKMLNKDQIGHIGNCLKVKQFDIPAPLSIHESFEYSHTFTIQDSYLYLFNTEVAFFCLGLSYASMNTLYTIYHPGYTDQLADCFYTDEDGHAQPFKLVEYLNNFFKNLGLEPFFDNQSSLFLEAYTYHIAVVPNRFQELETLKQVTFNLHKFVDLDSVVEDDSEEDVRYVYGVKDTDLQSYRWACCVASQTISYIISDENMDLFSEMDTQAADGLPLITLALYEKYTCLHFTELLRQNTDKKMKGLRRLKKMMLSFQAFGTVSPANISRWHNVKQIYANAMDVNEIQTAIDDISNKINIVSENQKEIEESRNNAVAYIITIFGITSILASVLSIIQILQGGTELEWITTIVTTVGMGIVCLLAVLYTQKRY